MGSSWVEVAVASAEFTDDEPVGAGAVIVTVGPGSTVSSTPSSGPTVVELVPSPVPPSVASSAGSVIEIWPFDAV